MKHLFYILFFSFIIANGSAQVGVLTYDDSIENHFTLFSNTFGNDSYLIDNCGRLINHWNSDKDNGLSAAILPDGRLVRAYKETGSNIYQPSVGGGLQIISWDGELEWQYKEAGQGYIQHHDFTVMPNGNILFIGWEEIDILELEEMGMNIENINSPTIWFEYIKEVKPIGSETEIIWEWHMKDHLVQDQLSELETYGIIKDHPHKFDINYTSPLKFDVIDPFHANAIDYNPQRDEIVLNLRSIGELWILDHSTTITEAAGETGGNSGMGGDILFRWGNPDAYKSQIEEEDWKLFGAHGTNFVDQGLPDEGKIIIFNNGILRPENEYSTVEMIEPLLDEDGFYVRNSDGQFELNSHEIIYGENQDLYSGFQANAHQLPNGDFFVNESDNDRMLQINDSKEIVWEYKIPFYNDFPLNQEDSNTSFLSFISLRYAADYEGFQNVDLTPGDLIEQNVIMDFCAILPQKKYDLSSINFIQNDTEIIIENIINEHKIRMISVDGKIQPILINNTNTNITINISNLKSGMFYLQVLDGANKLYNFPFVHME